MWSVTMATCWKECFLRLCCVWCLAGHCNLDIIFSSPAKAPVYVDLGCVRPACCVFMCAHARTLLSTQIHRPAELDNIRHFQFWNLLLQNNLLTFCSSEGADICRPILGHWSHHQQWRYVKSSLFLCLSAVLSHTHLWPFIAFPSLFLSVTLLLSVASGNKALTGRAWRSWLLDGKGKSHSWAGQACSLAKVVSCVPWGRGVFFFPYGHLVWWGKCLRVLW